MIYHRPTMLCSVKSGPFKFWTCPGINLLLFVVTVLVHSKGLKVFLPTAR